MKKQIARAAMTGLAGMVVSAGLVLPSTGRAAGSRQPACTHAALTAAVRRDGQRFIRRGEIPGRSFACAGRYATAGEIVGTRPHRVEITVLFLAAGPRWRVISRTRPCERHLVPRRIFRAACESN